MPRRVCCRLLNQTGYSRATLGIDTATIVDKLIPCIQHTLNEAKQAITILYHTHGNETHLDFYCDANTQKSEHLVLKGIPQLEDKLPELRGAPIKIQIYSDDFNLQQCLSSFEQHLNIQCIAQPLVGAKQLDNTHCDIEIIDARFESEKIKFPLNSQLPRIVLKFLDTLDVNTESNEHKTLFWPFFDSDLYKLIGEIRSLRKLKVLVADDSKPSKVATMVMLEHLGCETLGADDGIEALALSQAQAFDVIFLDERMPGLFGSDVAQQLHNSDGFNRTTPKVSLTGITDREAVETLYSKGITHHIEKPITKVVLENFLQQCRKL